MECISILELLKRVNEDACILTGFNDALVGISKRCGHDPIACYDYDVCIDILMDDRCLSEDDARDYFEDFVIGSWMGDGTPAFLVRCGEE